MMSSLDPAIADAASPPAELTPERCAQIVAIHGPLVRAACRRILRDEATSEDAVQETFVLLVRKARTLPAHTPLAGWLYHAACHTARNHLRTAMRRHTRETSPEAREHATPETTDDLWRELEPHLDEAMLALPARQRDLVVQCYFQNQSQREAARALGCSESVASRELHAAIEALRRFFARRGLGLAGGSLAAAISANAARGQALPASAKIVGAMLAARHLAAGLSLAALLKSGGVKIAAAVLVAAGVVSYKIISSDSPGTTALVESNTSGPAESGVPDDASRSSLAQRDGARVAQEALAAVPRFASRSTLAASMLQALLCRDVGEQLAALHGMGVTISRSALETVVQDGSWWTKTVWGHNKAPLSVRDLERMQWSFFDHLLEAWARETPLDALAWLVSQPDYPLHYRRMESKTMTIFSMAVRNERIAPPAWDALLEAAPCRETADFIEACRQMSDDPVAFLKNVAPQFERTDQRTGIVHIALEELAKSDPASALSATLESGDPALIEHALFLVAAFVKEPARLLELADADLAGHPIETNLLRALSGDPAASYPDASDHVGEMRDALYRKWICLDADSAVRHALAHGEDDLLEGMIQWGLRKNVEPARFASWIADISPDRQTPAWDTYYKLRGLQDPAKTLEEIAQTPPTLDEMRLRKSVIASWGERAPAEAAKWLRENPLAADARDELLATVAEHWAARDATAGLALAAAEGLPMTPRLAAKAAGNFAIDHTLPETVTFLRQFQNDDEYQAALGTAAASAFRGRLVAARDFILQNRRGNALLSMVEMLAAWEIDSPVTAREAAQEFLRLNVAELPGESVQTAANHLAKHLAFFDRLSAAFDWTLRLPATTAPGARQALLSSRKSAEERRQIGAWLQTAPLPSAERTTLRATMAGASAP